jgi:hypothetical protein
MHVAVDLFDLVLILKMEFNKNVLISSIEIRSVEVKDVPWVKDRTGVLSETDHSS